MYLSGYVEWWEMVTRLILLPPMVSRVMIDVVTKKMMIFWRI